jgi:hypothetical protein
MSAFVGAWLPISDFQAGLIIGAAVTLAVVAIGELVRVALGRRDHPKLVLTHEPFAVSNPHEGYQAAYLHFSIHNTGGGWAHDWRMTISSEGARLTLRSAATEPVASMAAEAATGERWEVQVASGEGDAIRPSADHVLPTLRADVPNGGRLRASYVLHTGPHRWEGTFTLENVARHRSSVVITRADA